MSGAPAISLRQPSAAEVRAFLARQKGRPFSYPHVGATRGNPPAGFDSDHNRTRLGSGDAAFDAARAAIRSWRMARLGWVELRTADEEAPPATGLEVAMLAHLFGLWWLNAARVVYTVDEDGPVRRFGFAYGTLEDHAEMGEERFTVEQLEDGSVWYDLYAFSRPAYWPVRLGYPLARRLQRRFQVDSKAAMEHAVRETTYVSSWTSI
ncbi:MAG TPA: DUF1990 domain-containing protein [Thermoanaerobaculia bacterium]